MKKLILILLMCSASAMAIELDAFKAEIKKTNVAAQLLQVAHGTYVKKEYDKHVVVMERLVEINPENVNWVYMLARAYALVDDKTAAYNALLALQNLGLSYPLEGVEEFANIRYTGVYDHIVEGLKNNGKAYGEGQEVASVSEHYSGLLLENLIVDSERQRFLLPSIRNGQIYTLTFGGEFKPFITLPEGSSEGPYGAVDAVIDEKNEVLWVASATMPQFNGSQADNIGQSMVMRYDLKTGKALGQANLSQFKQPALFNQLTVTSNGDVLLFNLFSREVIKVAKDGSESSVLVTLHNHESVKALATDEDNKVLYFADYERGVFVVNLENKKMIAIKSDEVNLYGVNDLHYHEGDLIVVQSGVKPQRVLRLLMNEKVGLKTVLPLEANHLSFGQLGNADVKGNHVYTLANSQWSKMDLAGNLLPEQSWEALKVIKSPLDYKMKEQLEMQQKIEEYKKKRGLK